MKCRTSCLIVYVRRFVPCEVSNKLSDSSIIAKNAIAATFDGFGR